MPLPSSRTLQKLGSFISQSFPETGQQLIPGVVTKDSSHTVQKPSWKTTHNSTYKQIGLAVRLMISTARCSSASKSRCFQTGEGAGAAMPSSEDPPLARRLLPSPRTVSARLAAIVCPPSGDPMTLARRCCRRHSGLPGFGDCGPLSDLLAPSLKTLPLFFNKRSTGIQDEGFEAHAFRPRPRPRAVVQQARLTTSPIDDFDRCVTDSLNQTGCNSRKAAGLADKTRRAPSNVARARYALLPGDGAVLRQLLDGMDSDRTRVEVRARLSSRFFWHRWHAQCHNYNQFMT